MQFHLCGEYNLPNQFALPWRTFKSTPAEFNGSAGIQSNITYGEDGVCLR